MRRHKVRIAILGHSAIQQARNIRMSERREQLALRAEMCGEIFRGDRF